MAHFFRAPDRRQRFLLPVDMMEWLPEDDIVHLMVDAVGLIDLSKFEATCKVGAAGHPPFAPAMLLEAEMSDTETDAQPADAQSSARESKRRPAVDLHRM